MKKSVQITLLALFLTANPAFAVDDLDLEPCINGEVSSTGLFINQEAEDEYYKSLREAEALELEPCINGEVSASGLFASQAEEDRYRVKEIRRADNQMTSIGGEVVK